MAIAHASPAADNDNVVFSFYMNFFIEYYFTHVTAYREKPYGFFLIIMISHIFSLVKQKYKFDKVKFLCYT